MRNARPRKPLIPALIATSFFDGGAVWVENEFNADTVAVAVTVVVAETVLVLLGDLDTVAVAVTVVVSETVSVLLGDVDNVAVAVTVVVAETGSVSLGDVEPDVRLKITSPAGTEKGV